MFEMRLNADRRALADSRPQVFDNLFDFRGIGSRENEQITPTFTAGGDDIEIFRKEPRFAGNHHAFEIDRLRKRPPAFSSDEQNLSRFFVHRDQGAEKIRWDASAAPAETWNDPGDGFTKVLFAKYFEQSGRNGDGQFSRDFSVSRAIQFFPGQPDFRFRCAQNSGSEIEKQNDRGSEDRQGDDRIMIN